MSFLGSFKGCDGSDEGSGGGGGSGGSTVSPVCFRLVFLGLGSFTTPTFFLSGCLLHATGTHVSWERPYKNHHAIGPQFPCRSIQIDPTLVAIPWFSLIRVLCSPGFLISICTMFIAGGSTPHSSLQIELHMIESFVTGFVFICFDFLVTMNRTFGGNHSVIRPCERHCFNVSRNIDHVF